MMKEGEYPESGLTECKEVVEVQRAFLCLSFTQSEMNKALTRASIYVEGLMGIEADTVVPLSNYVYLRLQNMVGGHDLKVSRLIQFYEDVQEACFESSGDPDICLNPNEEEIFNKLILPLAKEDKEAVVITFAIRSSMSYQMVVSHEIMHAQYFLQDEYQKVIDEFWENDVSDEDKSEIASILSRVYNVEDELLLKNEFQAYILMAGAEASYLKRFLSKYRDLIFTKMRKVEVEPIQVQ